MSALIEGSWDAARLVALNSFQQLPHERVDLNLGIDRTLATDVQSKCDLPTYATSAMDGYAVAGNGPWSVIGEVKAGLPMKGALIDGQAVGIATGAVIPNGTRGIIRWENALVTQQSLQGDVIEGQDIRPPDRKSVV